MSDLELLRRFEDCTLPAGAWTHEAHVRTAWIYLSIHDEPAALDCVRRGIQRYNDAVLHKAHAYHETITVAFVRLIADRRGRLAPGHDFAEFKKHSLDLLDRQLSALLRHYHKDLLFSEAARREFLPPDLEPLPLTISAISTGGEAGRADHPPSTAA